MTIEDKDKEPEVDIEIEDDTPEADKGRDLRPDDVEADIPDDDEISKYTERAQKRIKHVKWEFHEERRRKEESERLRDQAVDYARAQHNELVRLRQTLASGETSLVNTNKTGSEARLASARLALRAANESGDSEAIVKAQEELATSVSDRAKWAEYQPRHQVDQNDPRMKPVAPRQPEAKFEPPRPTPEAAEWGERNPWFGKNEYMTSVAFGVHKKIIDDGVTVDSDDYYKKLDKEMVRVFPSEFKSEAGSQSRQKNASSHAATVVASSSRTEGTPRKVKLTTSQVALARRLGITPEAYALEMLKSETGQ